MNVNDLEPAQAWWWRGCGIYQHWLHSHVRVTNSIRVINTDFFGIQAQFKLYSWDRIKNLLCELLINEGPGFSLQSETMHLNFHIICTDFHLIRLLILLMMGFGKHSSTGKQFLGLMSLHTCTHTTYFNLHAVSLNDIFEFTQSLWMIVETLKQLTQ